MPDPANAIQDKAERAIQAVIRAADTGIPDAQIFTAFSSGYDEKVAANSVRIEAESAIEDGHNSGNYRMTVRVSVETNLDQDEVEVGGDEDNDHMLLSGAVFDALCDDELAEELSVAVSDFHVFDSIVRSFGRRAIEHRKATSEMTLEMSCVPSELG